MAARTCKQILLFGSATTIILMVLTDLTERISHRNTLILIRNADIGVVHESFVYVKTSSVGRYVIE